MLNKSNNWPQVLSITLGLLCTGVEAVEGGDDGASNINEIVITAQRREEKAFEVPISVSIVNAEALEAQGIIRIMDLTQAVPGLLMSSTAIEVQPSIRGVQTQLGGPGQSANVGIYLDNVYQPKNAANNFDFPDIERVEVLKGPQGTLYGRNVTGGAIKVFTKNPNLDALEGNVATGYGNFNTRYVKGYVSSPIVNNILAYSLSASYRKSDGWIDNLFKGDKSNPSNSWNLRGKLLYQPNNALKILATGYSRFTDDPTAPSAVSLNGNTSGASESRVLGLPVATKPHTTSVNTALRVKSDSYGGGVSIEYDFGEFTLSSITSYENHNQSFRSDGDFSPIQIATYGSHGHGRDGDEHENVQQEFLLSTNGERMVDWVVGAYYFKNDTFSLLDVPLGSGVVFNVYKTEITEAMAIFGEANWHINDRLSLILGYRQSEESFKINANLGVNISGSPSTFPEKGDENWSSGTPRVSISYSLNDVTNVYASYSEGFKSGLIDSNTFNVLDPEEIKAYEVGIKTENFAGWRLEAAAYFYDYTNQQVDTFTDVAGVPLGTSANAASTEIMGFELSAFSQLTESFSLNMGLSILDSEVVDYPLANINIPIVGGGNMSSFVDVSGNTGVRSPDWTLATTLKYEKDFSMGHIGTTLTIYHSDNIYFDYGNRIEQDAYTTLDSRIDWDVKETPWRLSIWGRNLTDEEYIVNTFITGNADAVQYAMPASYGVEVKYTF